MCGLYDWGLLRLMNLHMERTLSTTNDTDFRRPADTPTLACLGGEARSYSSADDFVALQLRPYNEIC